MRAYFWAIGTLQGPYRDLFILDKQLTINKIQICLLAVREHILLSVSPSAPRERGGTEFLLINHYR